MKCISSTKYSYIVGITRIRGLTLHTAQCTSCSIPVWRSGFCPITAYCPQGEPASHSRCHSRSPLLITGQSHAARLMRVTRLHVGPRFNVLGRYQVMQFQCHSENVMSHGETKSLWTSINWPLALSGVNVLSLILGRNTLQLHPFRDWYPQRQPGVSETSKLHFGEERSGWPAG